ncbi:Spo0B domain-containing protein [Paenibacillus sp. WLX2291]|uniref:Spo0B domain-containing protein n=1 Tax=Paenibacillus sp. WLX2291 TaxID=3296934 RepID=UPI003983EBD7
MKHFGWRPAVLAGTIILPLVAAYRIHTIPIFILLGLWIAVVYILSLKMVYGEMEEQRRIDRIAFSLPDKQNEDVYATAIEAFSHHRHDWMNDLQLLYGYIQMGNRERLIENIERIKEQMVAESRVAKLGVPELVFYLQTFKAIQRDMQLELEIEDGISLAAGLTPQQCEELTRVMQQTISAYAQHGGSSWGECPTLLIMIRSEEQELECIFEPDENYPDAEGLWLDVQSSVQSTGIVSSRLEEDPASITLHISPLIALENQEDK